MASNGITALKELLQEMQALMGILPVAMVPLVPQAADFSAGQAKAETAAETDARIEAGFDNMPV